MESQYTNAGASAVSEAVVDQLRRTKGWARFFSVMLWIAAVFLIIGGFFMLLAGSAAAFGGLESAGFGGAMGIGMAALYWVMAIFYVFPALKLGGFASRIGDLESNPVEMNLVAALDQQRSFWKIVGIFMIVFLALYLVVILGAVAMAGVGAAASGL